MRNKNRVWILGAADPEMEAIASIIAESGEPYGFACIEGERVRPFNAYKADGGRWVIRPDHIDTVVFVECYGRGFDDCNIIKVDHHNPGDPGHGAAPSDFLNGSSLGQTLRLLLDGAKWVWMPGLEEWQCVPNDGTIDARMSLKTSPFATMSYQDVLLCAAADHCLTAAYQGECPGVSPNALAEWRAKSRASFQGVSVDEVIASVEAAKVVLASAPRILFNDSQVIDMRGLDAGREGPEASAQLGLPFLYRLDANTQANKAPRAKVGLLGGNPKQVEYFIETWAASQGLVDVYGSPQRGYCGAFEP